MARNFIAIVDELFEAVTDPIELKFHVKMVCKSIHEANNKQSARVFGVNRHSTGGMIKQALKDQLMPKIDYNPNLNPKR